MKSEDEQRMTDSWLEVAGVEEGRIHFHTEMTPDGKNGENPFNGLTATISLV